MLSQAAVLLTALLFGGMVLYSFGFASFLFSALPAEAAGPLLRRAFPHFYAFVIGCALAGAALTANLVMDLRPHPRAHRLHGPPGAAGSMPAINAASDVGNRRRFGVLHTGSVLVTLAHIVDRPR